jgi:hypothetical protein
VRGGRDQSSRAVSVLLLSFLPPLNGVLSELAQGSICTMLRSCDGAPDGVDGNPVTDHQSIFNGGGSNADHTARGGGPAASHSVSIQIWLIDTFQRSTVALIMFSVGCGRHAFYRARLQWMQCRSDHRGAFDRNHRSRQHRLFHLTISRASLSGCSGIRDVRAGSRSVGVRSAAVLSHSQSYEAEAERDQQLFVRPPTTPFSCSFLLPFFSILLSALCQLTCAAY